MSNNRAHLSTPAWPVEVQKVAPPSPRIRSLRAARITPWSWCLFLPRASGPPGPHLGANPLPFPGPFRARVHAHGRTRAPTHPQALDTRANTHTPIPLHAHRGETFLGSIPSLSSSRARWKINIGKPGSNGRASTATSVQAPSRYHPYSSSPFSRCASPLPVNPLAVPFSPANSGPRCPIRLATVLSVSLISIRVGH